MWDYKSRTTEDYYCDEDFQKRSESKKEYEEIRAHYLNNYPFIEMSLLEMYISTYGENGRFMWLNEFKRKCKEI